MLSDDREWCAGWVALMLAVAGVVGLTAWAVYVLLTQDAK